MHKKLVDQNVVNQFK